MILDFTLKKEPSTGRGLYAVKPIRKGSLICECPLLIVPTPHKKRVERTPLIDYTFDINGKLAIPLGYGGLFNHHQDNNVEWGLVDDDLLEFRAVKNISPDEQLFINYGYEPIKVSPARLQEFKHRYENRATVLSNKPDETTLHTIRDWASVQTTPWKVETMIKKLRLKKEPTAELNYLVQDEYLVKVGDSYAWVG